MEKIYTSYTKVMNGDTYFFVKQFLVFPEIPDLSPILEQYGMHLDFDKACSIASIKDEAIKNMLRKELQSHETFAKVIAIDSVIYNGKKLADY